MEATDLFASRRISVAQPRRRLAGTVACVACGLRADVLLCRECLTDVPATRRRVRAWLDNIIARENEALAEWDWTRQSYRPYWEKIQDARELQQPDCDERARKAHRHYATLLDAEAEYQRTLAALGEQRARLERALGEIDQL